MTLRELLVEPAEVVAPALLGHVLERDEEDGSTTRARIVETEAYGPVDPASHAARGRTTANASMFAEPGTAYVYFTYGMHFCLNVATGPEGHGAAVLFRAAEVLCGHEVVERRRAGRRPLLSGPARLAQGLGVDRDLDGVDLLDPASPLRLVGSGPTTGDSAVVSTPAVATGPRVGVREAADVAWRFWFEDHPDVSPYRRHPRAPAERSTPE